MAYNRPMRVMLVALVAPAACADVPPQEPQPPQDASCGSGFPSPLVCSVVPVEAAALGGPVLALRRRARRRTA